MERGASSPRSARFSFPLSGLRSPLILHPSHFILSPSLLKSRERAVIARRFGFDGYQSMTLEVISTELGCTRERVRQIQDDALKRMRRASSRRQALQFLQATPPPAAHAVPLLSGRCAA